MVYLNLDANREYFSNDNAKMETREAQSEQMRLLTFQVDHKPNHRDLYRCKETVRAMCQLPQDWCLGHGIQMVD